MFRLRGKALRFTLSVVIAMLVLGTFSETWAWNGSQTITVVNRLVVWARPTLSSPVISVLMRGRHFTVNGRSSSGRWIHGITDMGIAGWLPSFGFLRLHREVNLFALPVMFTSMPMQMSMPRSRSGY